MAGSEPTFVTLKGGAVASRAALTLLWRLEGRAFALQIAEDGRLQITPAQRLTADDCARIRAHLGDLKQLVLYCEAIQ